MPALLVPAGQIVSPLVPQTDWAVGPNFERFDGLTLPATNPATGVPDSGGTGEGADYGFGELSAYPRPGAVNTPLDEQVYTPGPIKGVVGTVGGQPYPAQCGSYRTVDTQPSGAYTPGKTHSVQFRLGVGQNGPSALGAQQTNQLSEITNNPPQPGDLSSIIAGLG